MKPSDKNWCDYKKKLETISSSLKAFSEQGCRNGSEHLSLNKTTSNLFRARPRAADKKIDVKNFNKVISVDQKRLTVAVEGMTTYEDLVKETLKYSCLPTVVPELKSITIGGAISGCGIESSSFRYGLVHESILEMDILLSDGRVITCTPTNEHRDLFFAIPNTFGSLGYILKARIQLIPVKNYVKLTHLRFSDSDRFFRDLHLLCGENRSQTKIDYIDGVIFDRGEMYIILGEFVDKTPWISNYKYMNIYYRSIQEKKIDYLTIDDYIWRWDSDWFWCSKVFCLQNPMLRFLTGKWMLNSKKYSKIMHFFDRHPLLTSLLTRLRGKTESVIQDILIPIDKATEFYNFFVKEIGITPIWICPTQARLSNYHYNFCPLNPEILYIDFGFWESIPTIHEEGYFNKKIERQTRDLSGFKSLYSTSYYSEDEFWSIFDKATYAKLKEAYDPQHLLRDFFAKCTKTI